MLIDFEQLKQMTKYDRAADVVRCLRLQGVKCLTGKDGKPFTSEAAINRALGLESEHKEEIEF